MALSGVGTYLPTLKEFIVHWNTLNVAVGERVTLAGGFGIQDLEQMRQDLATEIQVVEDADAARDAAQARKEEILNALRVRVKQYRAALASQLPNTEYRKQAPALPTYTASGKQQVSVLCNLHTWWEKLNEDHHLAPWKGPLKLAGGYTVTHLGHDVEGLRQAYNIYGHALQASTVCREKRTKIMRAVATRLRQYRQAAIANLEPGHPLLENLPTVAAAGKTPVVAAGVHLTGEWDGARRAAVLSWTTAPDEDHERFEVRFHPGPKYKDSEEQVVGSVLKGVLSVITDYGLSAPSTSAWFKVYNITTTGEERGSNAVKLARAE